MSILDDICIEFHVGRNDLERYIQRAPIRYKSYEIKKRSGGTRTIAQPSRVLKIFQRYVTETRLKRLPVHPAAMAYAPGTSIKNNAEAHSAGRFILKLDFEAFFPSITVMAWRRLSRLNPDIIPLNETGIFEKLLFWGDGSVVPRCLSIGAPSSPAISNAVMYEFDQKVQKDADRLGARYTRYADDITLSAPSREPLLALESIVLGLTQKQKTPLLRLNSGKRGLYGPAERRLVTGLVITPDAKVSLGRERKRLISSMLHRSSLGRLDVIQLSQLKGWLAFAMDCEPSFVLSLKRKYGDDAVDAVRRFYAPPKAT